jgi:hypothetical protein
MMFSYGHITIGLIFLGWVALHDANTFEIDFGALFVSAFSVFYHEIINGVSLIDTFMGVAIWGMIAFVLNAMRPSWLGAGDIYLFMFMGLVSGLTGLTTLIIMYCATSLAVAYYYSWVRGKPAFKSIFPAAPSAFVAVCVYKLSTGLYPNLNTTFGGIDMFPTCIPFSPALTSSMGFCFYALTSVAIAFWFLTTFMCPAPDHELGLE